MERECSWRVLEAPTAGRSGCNPGQDPVSPGQTVFLPGEGNGKTNGKPDHTSSGIGHSSGTGIGRSSEGAEHLCAVAQGGSEVVSGVARAETIWERIQPRESGVS